MREEPRAVGARREREASRKLRKDEDRQCILHKCTRM